MSAELGFPARDVAPSDRAPYARRLIELCGDEAADVAGLVEQFLDVIIRFGFDACACGAWTGMERTRAYRFYFNNWPADWLEIYARRDMFIDDPLVAEVQRRNSPFTWAELSRTNRHELQLIEEAHAYGWSGGLVIPVHGPAGYTGMVSLAALRAFDLSYEDRILLWTMSLALHERCRTTPGLGVASAEVRKLSSREQECFRWVASGKTDWETGQLVGISRSTVHFHIERVKQRLGVRSRVQAVALLVLHGAL